MNQGLNFPFLPNRITPFIGDIFRNTWSPTSNFNARLRLSVYAQENNHLKLYFNYIYIYIKNNNIVSLLATFC
jgi:hypothetical protein